MADLNCKREFQNFVNSIFYEGKCRLIEASEDDKRILKELGIKFPNPDLALFEGVYLMADAANRNRHYVSSDTVSKAVGTIKMKPVNWFHKRGQPIGVYINGSFDTTTKAMRTVGVLWRSLFPNKVAEIEKLIKSENSGQSFELTYQKSGVRKDTSIELFDITFKGGAILPRDKAACRDTSADVLAKMQKENVVMGGLNIESDKDSVKSGGGKEMADKNKKVETKKAENEIKKPEKKVDKKEPEKKVESKKIGDMTLEELQSSLSKDSISAEERNHIIDAIVQKKVDKILADKARYNERRATLTEFTDEELANINILRDEIFDRLSKDNQIKVLQKTVADHERSIMDIQWLERRIHQLQHDKQDKPEAKEATGAEGKKADKKADKPADKKADKPADKKDDKAANKVGDKKDGKDNTKNKAADTNDGGKDKKSSNKSNPSDTGNPDKDKGDSKGDDKKDTGTDKKVDKKTDTKDKAADKKDGSDNKNTDDKDKNTTGKLLTHGMPKVVDESVKKQMINVHEKREDK